jgi:crossover junction endodeoxyribonuclease RuvC
MGLRILGIDPGTHCVGYGLIEHSDWRAVHLQSGTIEAPATDLGGRLAVIHREVARLLSEMRPEVLVLERIFHGKNVGTLVKIGEGRGVILLAAAQAGTALAEYAPAVVKKALCGRGAAPKEQVAFLVRQALSLPDHVTLGHDATDALALAVCHAHRVDFLALTMPTRKQPAEERAGARPVVWRRPGPRGVPRDDERGEREDRGAGRVSPA